MITKLSDVFVISDLDGTLLTSTAGIPSCNVETIRLFTMLGGNFTIATGRSIQSAGKYIEKLNLTMPAILYHGGAIYDYAEDKTVCHCTLNKSEASNVIADVMQLFPEIGVEIMAANKNTYLINSNEETYQHYSHEDLPYIAATARDVTCGWYKVLFAGSGKQKAKLAEYLKSKKFTDVYFSATDKHYIEMLPKGINKGIALKKLCKTYDIPLENTFAIGNYYNDLDILRAAGCAVAVGDSVDEVKSAAKLITGNCLDGGVAQFLYELIRKYA